MLSKRKEYQNEIYMACQKSGDVNINDRFKGVRFLGSVFFERLCHNKWLIFDEK